MRPRYPTRDGPRPPIRRCPPGPPVQPQPTPGPTARSTRPLLLWSTATGYRWAIEEAGRPPADAPWHEGTIRYMKEKGYWQAEDQAWHDQRLARLERVVRAWEEATEAFEEMRAAKAKAGERVDQEAAWPAYWENYRAEHLVVGN
jgi:hypothetical protein